MHSLILSTVLDVLPQMQLDRVVGMNDRAMRMDRLGRHHGHWRLNKRGEGAGGKCRLSWGVSLDWHVSSLLPLCGPGAGD